MKLRSWILFGLYTLIVAGALATGYVAVREMQFRTRGVTYGTLSDPTNAFAAPVGVNVALEQYTPADLRRALADLQAHRVSLVRQHFYWKDMEPRPGDWQWADADRIVAETVAQGMDVIAVLDTTPVWARDPGEADLDTAPPVRVDDYARWIAAFVRRYGDRIHHVQIWDNPNVHPYWGRHVADPFEYTALLHAAAVAARTANPTVQIISAGLSPSGELIRGRPDYCDVLFLRGMYDAGARADFDILGVKAYGMWTGPDDRRVATDVFNLSRVILLREEMVRRGDAAKPVWALEFGWNALPEGWQGKPSPWGSDTEAVQSARLAGGVQRIRREWPWVKMLIAQTYQPNASADDPAWGLALVGRDGQPRQLFTALQAAAAAPVSPAVFNFSLWYAVLVTLAAAVLVALWRGAVAGAPLPWRAMWQALAARFAAWPEPLQIAALAASVAALYSVPNTVLSLGLLVLIVLLFSFRLDVGLALAIVTIPFYLLPKSLGSMQFSLVELLTLACAAGWLIGTKLQVKSQKLKAKSQDAGGVEVAREAGSKVRVAMGPFSFELLAFDLVRIRVGRFSIELLTFDLAILFFVLAGLLSVKAAANFGVANREFRVIVCEPALLYALVRLAHLSRRELWRLVDAFLLSALAVALIGLYQYAFTNWVIVGEGVRRILAVYGSPNNLALYLDRALPILIVLALYAADRRRQVAYAIAACVIAVCWYLTYSRAAWLGVAASLVWIAWFSGRRVRMAMAGLVVIGAVMVIPFLATDRAQSLFQSGTGTGFFRVSVWTSGVRMIADHPLLGVGLDNFLYQYPKYMLPEAWREPNLSHPHNIVLDFWVRMGIPGVVALAWMLFEFFRRAIRQLARERTLMLGLSAGMVAALVHGQMDAAYFYVDLAFVFMLFFALVAQSKVIGRLDE